MPKPSKEELEQAARATEAIDKFAGALQMAGGLDLPEIVASFNNLQQTVNEILQQQLVLNRRFEELLELLEQGGE